MKNLFYKLIIGIFSIIPILGYSQNNDFVSLQGKQFKLNNLNFYPVTVNYKVDIVRNIYGLEFIAPHHSYDLTNDYEITDGSGVLNENDSFNQILNDFQTIKDMGFNSIRLIGFEFTIDPNNGTSFYKSYDSNFNEFINNFQSPYTTTFNFIQKALDAAQIKGLKVELLSGSTRSAINTSYGYLYINYLQSLASHFSNNSTLFAYDFINEPLYEDNNIITTKAEACEIVKNWHNTVKAVAPKHLTTIGLATASDVFKWDPGFLKLDFLSFHVYPGVLASEGYDQQKAIDRVKSEIKWISETSILPWVIGETGFTANSDDLYNLDMGTLQDQKYYAEQTLNYVRDCGGSGYSWWQYQDVRWNPNDNYFGLLGYSNNLKPVTLSFINFNPFNIGSTPSYPSNYYNYFYHTNYLISGTVKNEYNQPIKNAVVEGKNNAYNILGRTFTDEYGNYYLYSEIPIDVFYVSAPKSSSFIKYNVSNAVNINVTLKQFLPKDELILNNVNASNYSSYQANKSVILSNFIVNSNIASSVTSSGSIKLKTGFQSKYSSNFHAYINYIFADCNDVLENYGLDQSTYVPPPINPRFEEIQNQAGHSHTPLMENNILSESTETNVVTLYPNPNKGVFKLISKNGEINNINIFNTLGQIIYQNNKSSSNHSIDISNQSKGVYYINFEIGNINKSVKIIIE